MECACNVIFKFAAEQQSCGLTETDSYAMCMDMKDQCQGLNITCNKDGDNTCGHPCRDCAKTDLALPIALCINSFTISGLLLWISYKVYYGEHLELVRNKAE
ncbi:MAG: hypothetical protein JKY23_00370 [Nitrospinaceae bacterium]|nr:hypothetical protein [Nitrospinaceae bacterium]